MAMASPSIRPESEYLDERVSQLVHNVAMGNFALKSLDKLIGGARRGRVTYFAARPGLGKTSLLVQLKDDLAAQDVAVVYYSLELGASEIDGKSLVRLSNGALTPDSLGDADKKGALAEAKAAYKILAENIYIVDRAIDQAELSKIIGQIQCERGSNRTALMVDYLQVMPSAVHTSDERLGIKAAAAELRGIANAYDIPVFAISSIARTGYDKEPDIQQLSGSQSIEYGADTIVALSVTGNGAERAANAAKAVRPITARVIKARYGSSEARAELIFDAPHATFLERR